MPELPEAEANRLRVEEGALNRTIARITLHDTKPMDMPLAAERKRFEGTRFTGTRRHGKYIFIGSKSGPWLVVHLGMTGSLRPFDKADGPPDHAKLVVEFEGGSGLAFRCPRKFGWVRMTEDPEGFIAERGIGPDALEIGKAEFLDRMSGTKSAVKSALIDQKRLAGVGNLWSDEVLYRAGIAPDRRTSDLKEDALSSVFKEMRGVLSAVLKTRADYAELPGDWLIHHRSKGETCPRCGGVIEKTTVGGRSAYHCPKHQR